MTQILDDMRRVLRSRRAGTVESRRCVQSSRAEMMVDDAWIGITYDVSLEKQKVVVKGDVKYDYVLERIKKTGKEVGFVAAGVLFLC